MSCRLFWWLNPRLVMTTTRGPQLCHEGVKVIRRDALDEAAYETLLPRGLPRHRRVSTQFRSRAIIV